MSAQIESNRASSTWIAVSIDRVDAYHGPSQYDIWGANKEILRGLRRDLEIATINGQNVVFNPNEREISSAISIEGPRSVTVDPADVSVSVEGADYRNLSVKFRGSEFYYAHDQYRGVGSLDDDVRYVRIAFAEASRQGLFIRVDCADSNPRTAISFVPKPQSKF